MKQCLLGVPLVFGLALPLVLAPSCTRTTPPPTSRATYERVLPANASAVDIVFDLVGPERVVAVPETIDEFSNVHIGEERFGPERRFAEFNTEVLLGFDPDLVVVSPWQGQDTIERMREAGAQVFEMGPVGSFESLRSGILDLGKVLGEDARAAELVDDVDRRVRKLRTGTVRHRGETAVSYTNYGSGGWIAGSGTTADMVMGLAGLVNIAAESGIRGHDTVNIEALLTWDPDWIVVSNPSTTYGVTRSYLENEAALKDLRAIRLGHIVGVPAALFSTTSHYLVDAAEALAVELGRVGQDDIEQAVEASE